MEPSRRLAAILFTDIVGSTAIMQKDEHTALLINKRYVAILNHFVVSHGGEILNDFGDGSLCSFGSATQAVQCAMEMQQEFRSEPKVPLRIGLHVGEIFIEGGKVFGDGVNIASRVQSLGVANSILFSSEICSKIKNQPEFKSVSIGKFEFKNVDEKMEVFALTNEGLIVPDKRDMEGKLREKKLYLKRLLLPSAIIILGIFAFFVYRIYYKYPGFTGKDKSIAVLPFETISSDSGNEYINDGFTIDIINKLSNLSGLSKVPGWAIVKTFKDPKQNILDIAHTLGVEAILTGTIQKQGDNLHIVTELTDVNSGKTIWDMDDDRKWGDVLKLQRDVAEKIAASLSARLTQDDKNGINKEYTNNTDAYNYYIKGRYFWDKRTPQDQDSAEANYRKAIALDPDYALAYSGLADIYSINSKGLSSLDAIPIAKQYVAKALSLDSNLSEALATSGLITCIYDYDWAKAKALFEKAIAANSNYSFAHVFYGNLLQWNYNSTDAGLNEVKKGLSLDPLSTTINWALGRNYFDARKYDSAYLQLKKTYIMDPGNYNLRGTYSIVLVQRKNFAEALNVLSALPSGSINLMLDLKGPCISYLYAAMGDKVRAKTELEKSLQEHPNQSPYNVARAYIAIGDFDKALTYLETAYQVRDIRMWHIKVDPTLDPIRNEPRFKALLKKINMD